MSLRHLNVLAEDDDDPMLSAVNLVDVFLVLVVALLTAVAVQTQTSAHESVTIIRNAGQPDMEVVVREQGKEVRFKGAGSAAQGQGVRAGVAYKLEDGNIVYIPETGAAPASASAGGAGGAAAPAPAKP
ncbi:DUF2149 domain-containing protein [Acidovorax delafieldii]|uniref:DUF2149 domain-containing protein n=1 Tax=Acidovorax delafieldii TaxID=47920 RepID=A0A561XK08_ACIDE|nr:DUF2149 domain-containing protein [Acidovorax delafieldii]TWG36455.1 hypothetical protein ATF69_2836 [Acidovorax delafieldii]